MAQNLVKMMLTVSNTAPGTQLSAALIAGGYTGNLRFVSLQYTTPGSDYTTPNTGTVTVGQSTMVDTEGGRKFPAGVNFPEPALPQGAFYDPTQIYLLGSIASQRILIEAVTV